MKITKPKPTPRYTTHSGYILSLLGEITNEPEPNWTKWWHATAVFTKPLAASHLLALAQLQWGITACSLICNVKYGHICLVVINVPHCEFVLKLQNRYPLPQHISAAS